MHRKIEITIGQVQHWNLRIMQPTSSHLHWHPTVEDKTRTDGRLNQPTRTKNHSRCRHLKHYRLDSSKFVVNLSDKLLTAHHLSVFQKGLNFIPTPLYTNPIHTVKDTLLFNRRVRLAHFFQNSTDHRTDPIFPKLNTGWIPPSGLDPDVDSFIHHLLQNSLTPRSSRKPKSNLSLQELTALKDLCSDKSIVIKQADKGGATVIWSSPDYEKEALRQLNNRQHYTIARSSLPFEHHARITQCLMELSLIGHLPANSEKTLIYPVCQISPFYLLPKIHKAGNPGRPIRGNLVRDKLSNWPHIPHPWSNPSTICIQIAQPH